MLTTSILLLRAPGAAATPADPLLPLLLLALAQLLLARCGLLRM
jgi:hypothetical protein